jgi:hypothetical protein
MDMDWIEGQIWFWNLPHPLPLTQFFAVGCKERVYRWPPTSTPSEYCFQQKLTLPFQVQTSHLEAPLWILLDQKGTRGYIRDELHVCFVRGILCTYCSLPLEIGNLVSSYVGFLGVEFSIAANDLGHPFLTNNVSHWFLKLFQSCYDICYIDPHTGSSSRHEDASIAFDYQLEERSCSAHAHRRTLVVLLIGIHYTLSKNGQIYKYHNPLLPKTQGDTWSPFPQTDVVSSKHLVLGDQFFLCKHPGTTFVNTLFLCSNFHFHVQNCETPSDALWFRSIDFRY